ncbi:MAG: hypothetical protein RIC53_16335 [Cyclobacteriaceae bacterium]
MIRCILSSTLSLVSFTFSYSQNIPIETWRTHFSYNSIREIVPTTNRVICASTNGLFYIDPVNSSHTFLGKNDGFSDVSPTAIYYSHDNQTMVLGYASGLVDIMHNGKVITCRAIQNTPVIGSKKINAATVVGDRVYVGNSFGIVSINLNSAEVIENFRSIGTNGADVTVFELISSGGQLVAITSDGIQIGDPSTNLLDFTNWTPLINLDANYSSFKSLITSEGTDYVIANDTLVMKSTNGAFELFQESDQALIALTSAQNVIYGLTSQSIVKISETSISTEMNLEPTLLPKSFAYKNGFWIGSTNHGVYSPEGEFILPNGPISDNIRKIRFTNGQLHAFYGPHVDDYFDQTDSLGFNLFDNSVWTYNEISGVYNLTDAATFNGETFIASAGYGLYNYTKNSPVEGIAPSYQTGKIVIPELAVSDNLYIPCYEHHQPLYVMDKNGALTHYDSSFVITQSPIGVNVSDGEIIWLNRSTFDDGGLVVLDLDSDNFRIITRSDRLPSIRVNDFIIDQSDESWIATAQGLATFPDATFIFDDFGATEPVYNSENIFDDEDVTALEVDGGNRIWVGTAENGVWVFDNSFINLEYRFQVSNSPLPGNSVRDMTYNPATGEMYILTEKGLASFRSNSSESRTFHSNVNIFPNPVRPGYDGNVGIDGLTANANLKITDVNGKLIRELRANGGTASWDLLDYNRRRVLSGIYVVFSSSFDGEQTYIGKVAVVN